MRNNIGIIINRLAVGFTFAFVYQIIVAIATSIFSLPVTGVYGINFEHIPELSWEGSYFVTLAGTAVISMVMILWFKSRKWI